MRRYEGDIHTTTGLDAHGTVRTAEGQTELSKFIQDSHGINVLVSGELAFTGKTSAENHQTMIGVLSDNGTLTDELAHSLGNTPMPFGQLDPTNVLNDTYADALRGINEILTEHGGDMTGGFEDTLRQGASDTGCAAGQQNCGGVPPPR